MSARNSAWLLAAAGHFGVVICGAAYQFPDRDAGAAAQMLRCYGELSGARSTFGFFASPVGAPHRARFLLMDENGNVCWDSFDKSRHAEARLRLTGIVDSAFMTGAADEPAWRQRLVASWAATMFSRHPEAVSLSLVVEAWCVPGMREFRNGSRPDWQEVYRAEFERRSATHDGRGPS